MPSMSVLYSTGTLYLQQFSLVCQVQQIIKVEGDILHKAQGRKLTWVFAVCHPLFTFTFWFTYDLPLIHKYWTRVSIKKQQNESVSVSLKSFRGDAKSFFLICLSIKISPFSPGKIQDNKLDLFCLKNTLELFKVVALSAISNSFEIFKAFTTIRSFSSMLQQQVIGIPNWHLHLFICVTGRERLIRSHSSARFCFELSGNSN